MIKNKEQDLLPVVALGASAGGLEAFEQFFSHMGSESGIAFVVIQHMDSQHESNLGGILKSYTKMKIFEAMDGDRLKANRIYTIPANRTMNILNGVLSLSAPVLEQGIFKPIDIFFRSLAEDKQGQAIGVLLSGTGSEGALGLRAIQEQGGLSFAQDPETARYEAMPLNAVKARVYDYILAPEKMPEQILKFVNYSTISGAAKREEDEIQRNLLNRIIIQLRNQVGVDFSDYKQKTLIRRVYRRMALNQVDDLNRYCRYLEETPAEINILFREMLIGVTSFFRDPEAFTVLRKEYLPGLLKDKKPGDVIRIWVAACATGEEAYSLAILLQEYLEEHHLNYRIKLFASDLNAAAIKVARAGVYPETINQNVSESRLARFFLKSEGGYEVNKEIREMIVFAEQNVVRDPPFSRLDILSCRNLLIYLSQEVQRTLFSLFQYGLNQGGLLFLGASESIGQSSELFTTLDRKWKIYRRKGLELPFLVKGLDAGSAQESPPFLARRKEVGQVRRKLNFEKVVHRHLLEGYAPCAVLVNEENEAVHIHGHTGRFLEYPPGAVTLSIIEMAREGLKVELFKGIREVLKKEEPYRRTGLRIKENDGYFSMNLLIESLREPGDQNLLLVVFEETSEIESLPSQDIEFSPLPEDVSSGYVQELRRELRSTREYLQATIEELETSVEELRYRNEELQATNEEMQSSNEELETSKSQILSTNEDLLKLNARHQSKFFELIGISEDLDNLLAGTEIPAIYLNTKLIIQRFTPSTSRVINLIEADVGRSIADLSSMLLFENLPEDAAQVLETMNPKEIEVQTQGGVWYRMRIALYFGSGRAHEGVVITFIDITDLKKRADELESSLLRQRNRNNAMELLLKSGGGVSASAGNLTDSICITNLRGEVLQSIGSCPLVSNDRTAFDNLFEAMEAEVREAIIKLIGQVLNTGEGRSYSGPHLSGVGLADEPGPWFECRISAVREGEVITGLLFVFRDVLRLGE